MRLGRVIGNVVSTIKYEKLEGIKLMIVEPIDPDANVIGKSIIVADYLNTAIGNLIFWMQMERDKEHTFKRINIRYY